MTGGVSMRPTAEAVIWATVVSYNRKPLLERCLAALRTQTRRVDQIVVVDNGSTDGTSEWLTRQHDILVVTQANTGSAGGQNTALRTAFRANADWIWTMDDDGAPAPDCLERLLADCVSNPGVRAPLVVDADHPERLAFPWTDARGQTVWAAAETIPAEGGEWVPDRTTLFNGPLLHRSVVARVGLPQKEMFIWGDEWEYYLRLRQAGTRMAVNSRARFLHPANRMTNRTVACCGRVLTLPWSDDLERFEIIARNRGFIARRHRHGLVALSRIIISGLAVCLAGGEIRRAFAHVAGVLRGYCWFPGKGKSRARAIDLP